MVGKKLNTIVFCTFKITSRQSQLLHMTSFCSLMTYLRGTWSPLHYSYVHLGNLYSLGGGGVYHAQD